MGVPLLLLLYLISDSLIWGICGIWLDDKKKENGIKENMEGGGSGVIGPPLE